MKPEDQCRNAGCAHTRRWGVTGNVKPYCESCTRRFLTDATLPNLTGRRQSLGEAVTIAADSGPSGLIGGARKCA